MNATEVMGTARYAAEELRREIEEAEFYCDRTIKIHEILATLLKLVRLFKCIGNLLISLYILQVFTGSFEQFSRIFLEGSFSKFLEFFSLVYVIAKPFSNDLFLGLSLYVSASVFIYLLQFIAQSIVSSDKAVERSEKEIQIARSLLASLEQELNNIDTEGDL